MSSSALPRFYFDGHFYWNPSTNNNDDYAGSPTPLIPYDPVTGQVRRRSESRIFGGVNITHILSGAPLPEHSRAVKEYAHGAPHVR
jgi:hypothetical protein